MMPANLSAKMIGTISLLRGEPAAEAAAHARQLTKVYRLCLDGIFAASEEELMPLSVSRPGDLSQQILAALFGPRPSSDAPKPCRRDRHPGMSVTLVDWSEWERCVAATQAPAT